MSINKTNSSLASSDTNNIGKYTCKHLMLLLLVTFLINSINGSAQHKKIDRLRDKCEMGDKRSCEQLYKIAQTDKDISMRVDAINSISDQTVLLEITKNDSHDSTKLAATRKIENVDSMVDLIMNTDNEDVAGEILKKISNRVYDTKCYVRIANNAKKSEVCKMVSEYLAEQREYIEIAYSSEYCSYDILDKIRDPKIISNIAISQAHEYALSKIAKNKELPTKTLVKSLDRRRYLEFILNNYFVLLDGNKWSSELDSISKGYNTLASLALLKLISVDRVLNKAYPELVISWESKTRMVEYIDNVTTTEIDFTNFVIVVKTDTTRLYNFQANAPNIYDYSSSTDAPIKFDKISNDLVSKLSINELIAISENSKIPVLREAAMNSLRKSTHIDSYYDILDNNDVDLITDADGNRYRTITIGDQVWMAENLRVTHYNDNTPINYVTSDQQWMKLDSPAYCWYNDDKAISNSKNFGAYYNFHAVETGKICPKGWHVPNQTEWLTFENNIIKEYCTEEDSIYGKNQIEMTIAKAITDNNGWTNSENDKNKTGFSARPGGFRFAGNGRFIARNTGFWWSRSKSENGHVIVKKLNPYGTKEGYFISIPANKQQGICIRCIKDKQ